MNINYKIRAVQLDLARQMESMEFLKGFIDFIAENHYNTLFLYLEWRVRTKTFDIGKKDGYSAEELKEIIEYAETRGIDVIPGLAALGHAELILEQKKYAINSSAVYHIMGLVCLMLFLTYDASNVRGAVRTVRYFATALLSVFLLIIDALPHMLLSCFWMLKLDMFVLLDAIAIVFALYAFSKIFTAVDISSEPDVSEKNSDTL